VDDSNEFDEAALGDHETTSTMAINYLVKEVEKLQHANKEQADQMKELEARNAQLLE